MEELFEFLFGASGRINRAKYWRSVLIYIGAGMMTAVILFTAAGIAAPLFILMIVVVLIPWLLWGVSFTTRRLHDRDKSAWWLMLFYLVPGALGQVANAAWLGGAAGTALHSVLALAGFALTIWGFVEIGCLRGTAGPDSYGPDPLLQPRQRRRAASKNEKMPGGRKGHRAGIQSRIYRMNSPTPPRARLRSQLAPTVATIPKAPASDNAAMRASS
jgi:uncharacterized membrane protein YhaH (DUF805 family)